MPKLWKLAIGLLGFCLASALATAQTPTRFEAEALATPPDVNDVAGSIPYFLDADAGASGGIVERVGLPEYTIKVIFNGTGLDLIAPTASDEGNINWTLDDGAQTGSITTNGASASQVRFPIVSGLPKTLHTVEFQLATSGITGRYDAFDVYDSSPRVRIENDDQRIIYSPDFIGDGSAGELASADPVASGGSAAYTTNNGATVTVSFQGRAIALLSWATFRQKKWNWSIDGGLFSGTVDYAAADIPGTSSASDSWRRWPFVLKTGLTEGTHTLVLTVATGGANSADVFAAIDAIDIAPFENNFTRFEAETAPSPGVNDTVGYAFSGYSVDADTSASAGKLVRSATPDLNSKVIFAGTGIQLVAPATPTQASYTWTLDEGTTSGVVDVVAATTTPQVRFPLAGNLPNTIHTIELQLTTGTLRIDAFDVENSQPRARAEQNSGSFTYVGWEDSGLGDIGADGSPAVSADRYAYTLNTDATASCRFYGKAVALIALPAGNSGKFQWTIDGGAFQGVVDVKAVHLTGGIWFRWPFVLKNDLPDGWHTLELKAIDSVFLGGGDPGNIAAGFDAVDSLMPPVSAVNPQSWELY